MSTPTSPLMSCLPGAFRRFKKTPTPENSLLRRSSCPSEPASEIPQYTTPEFNDVLSFSPEEIIPTKYSLDHDAVSDTTVYARHLFFVDEKNHTVDTTQRLYKLRQIMIENSVDVYIIPSEDTHLLEYTAACDNRREYISGFGGLAGVAVVLREKAALLTDSRYFLEAERVLDDNWMLLRQGVQGYPTWQEWAITQAMELRTRTIALDARVTLLSVGRYFTKRCEETGCVFVPSFNNFVDEIWDGRPERSTAPIYELPYKYTGESALHKITRIREKLILHHATGVVVTKLDEVAWALNLRGSDFENTPVFFAYLIVTQKEVRLYIESQKVPPKVEDYLQVEIPGISIKPYDDFWIDLDALLIDFSNYSYLLLKDVLYGLVTKLLSIRYELVSLLEDLKSVKTGPELYGMKLAHVKDGVALARYFAWLEDKLVKGGHSLNEYQGALKCEFYRSLMANYKGPSFATILASGANAALNHYEPTFEDNLPIDPSKIYLCDLGAQYLDGTTDITRTLHFGTPTDEQKIAYTAVLRGHLALAMAHFPKTATGATLDTLARMPLWQEGLDFRHGTGHGIGSFLCVHEGPIYFGRDCHFKPGQVISNEPGYYKDYEYGIRIESDMEIKKSGKVDMDGDPYMKFGYLTLVPFERKLIIKQKLLLIEIAWVNTYHKHVRDVLTPYLMKLNDLRAAKWLYRATEEL